MNSVLINGNYSVEEAEKLINSLFKVKTDFHRGRMNSADADPRDVRDSSKRLLELEDDLENILVNLKKSNYKRIVMHARLVLEFCPAYENA